MSQLALARLKLGWAEDHLNTLDREIGEFLDGGFYSVGVKNEPEPWVRTVFMKITRPAPTDRWALMLGDVVHNLRASLDYAVYSLAILGSGQDPPKNFGALEFPIMFKADGNRGYDVKAPNKVTGVPAEAEAIIRDSQPFGSSEHSLYRLQKLSIFDKHRVLNPTVTFLRSFTAGNSTCEQVHPVTGKRYVLPLHDGMPLMSGRIFGPDDTGDASYVQVDATFDVLFDEGSPEPVQGEVVTETLKVIADAVRAILDALEASL